MEPAKTSRSFVLTFDSFITVLDVRVEEVRLRANVQPTARVRFSRSVLSHVVLDWHADVELLSLQARPPQVLIRGTATRVEAVNDDLIEMEIRTGVDLLEDSAVSGVQIENASIADVAWSVFMTAGVEPDKLDVEGKSDLYREVFQVMVPLFGMAVDAPVLSGRVKFLPPHGAAPVEVPSDMDHLAQPFRTCSGLAVAEVSASTLFDAEQRGLAEIDYALGTVLLVQRAASSDHLPAAKHYSRERSVAILGRHQVVAVVGRWGRSWIRNTQEVWPASEGLLTVVMDETSLPSRAAVPPAVQQAIASWRRAVQQRERTPALMAIWETLEFYSAEVKVPNVFTRSEMKMVRQRACVDLDEGQLDRLEHLIQGLNSAPIMVRLERAATDDGVILSVGDLAVLRELRSVRNDLVHGRSSAEPARPALRRGLGIATRLLLARLDRVAASTSQSTPSEPARTAAATLDLSPVEGRKAGRPSATFTSDDKFWAEQATEAAMLVIPYIDEGTCIPQVAASRVREVWGEATESALVTGVMRACDVALKHLAKHFFESSLEDSVAAVSTRLVELGNEDVADFGRAAYEDAELLMGAIVSAMRSSSQLQLPGHRTAGSRLFPAGSVALFALLFELAERYDIAPARAAGNLGLEIGTIIPRSK